ncbi:hypothetical protein [Nonomuraea dietziae]|uniref:hypothetical protein n=1 Tax=Nonomuraea dietziae TaxID=65515 RepID=UPI0034171504
MQFKRVGAKNSASLRDLRVFVDQPAAAVTPDDLDITLDRVGKGSQRSGLIEMGLIGSQQRRKWRALTIRIRSRSGSTLGGW